MALDKLVDSTKLDACLDAEADAIRAKTGGTSPIPYDYENNKGFADAIAAIPSGGGDDSVLVSLIDRSITEIRNDSVTSIGEHAFAGCSALTTVDLPNARNILPDAFADCATLTTVDLPNVTQIGPGAFVGCSSLAAVGFPNVTRIESEAFLACSDLTTVDLPNVTRIGRGAFTDISTNAIINLGAAEGKISGAPWGAPEGVTINYNVHNNAGGGGE